MSYWREGKTAEPHWLDLVEDEELFPGWMAAVKWDGCIHLHRVYGDLKDLNKSEDFDYIHICDINDFIARLEELRDKARKHFAGEPAWVKKEEPGDSTSED